MKALLITIVLVSAAVAAVLHFGGVTSWDPEAAAEELRALAVPGVDWETLADHTQPQHYRAYQEDPEYGLTTGVSIKFDRERFAGSVARGKMDKGFILEYLMAEGEVYTLNFDDDGKMVDRDALDLLDGSAGY